MKIKFSRHPKRRAKLYKISEETIINILNKLDVSNGKHEVVEIIDKIKYPLKVIFVVENETITIVTNYPLKKGKEK